MKLSPVGILLVAAFGLLSWAASVPFAFDCSKEAGFVMDPNTKSRIGYVTDFTGLNATLSKDLQVAVPFQPKHLQLVSPPGANGAPAKTAVVGVIEKFSWNGGASDPITIQFYVSQQNAANLKAVSQTTLKSTAISSLNWWIGDYDQEAKTWFDQAYLASSGTVKAVIAGASSITVDATPTQVKDGIDVSVYRVSLTFAPQAHTTWGLVFANSSSKPVTKAWGTP